MISVLTPTQKAWLVFVATDITIAENTPTSRPRIQRRSVNGKRYYGCDVITLEGDKMEGVVRPINLAVSLRMHSKTHQRYLATTNLVRPAPATTQSHHQT